MSDPIQVELNAEWNGGNDRELIEFSREEWESWTPEERERECETEASEFAARCNISWGYTVLGET